MNIQDYHICVSGLSAKIYLAKPMKNNPGIMSESRKLVDEGEFILAIEQWAEHKLEDGCRELEIKTESGKLVFSVVFPEAKSKKLAQH